MPATILPRHARESTIALLSEHAMFRDGVAALLHDAGFPRVTDFATEHELRAAAVARAPDIVIVDLDHETADTMAMTRALRRDVPGAYLIAIGTPLRAAAADSRFEATVETPAADRAGLVGATAGRKSARSRELVRELRRWRGVTPRQRDVMRWLAVGLDNAAIAARLGIGSRAVKAHVTGLLDLFRVHNRTQLALLALRAGLHPPGRHLAAG